MSTADPYLTPNTTLRNRAARALWGLAYIVLFRFSPRPLHAWRSMLLRLFGAQIGRNCRIYPATRIWAPWNLECEDLVAIADGAEIYNAGRITLGSHSIISQDAYLCAATHDYKLAEFPMICKPIRIGAYAWVAARATVLPGVTLGEGAVLGLGSIATHDLAPWSVAAGVPARRVGSRSINGTAAASGVQRPQAGSLKAVK